MSQLGLSAAANRGYLPLGPAMASPASPVTEGGRARLPVLYGRDLSEKEGL